MDEKNLTFFAMQINGLDAALFVTADEAMEAISEHLAVCDKDSYCIEPVSGIYELIRRMGAFEGYDDDWMEEVLEVTTSMVERAKNARMEDSFAI